MAAERDRRHVGGAGAAREHRAHVVDGDAAAELLRPRLEPVPHLTIQVGKREPANSALWRSADGGSLHDLVPQPLSVDGEITHRAFDHALARSAAGAQSFGPARKYCCARGTSAPSTAAACQPQRGSSSMPRASATISALASATIASACTGVVINPTTRVATPTSRLTRSAIGTL